MTQNEVDITVKLTEHDEKIGSLKHRVDDLEETTATIQQLALSVKELATNMSNMLKEQEKQGRRIESLEQQPAKRWDTLTTVVITAIASGLITYVMTLVLH